MSNVQPIPSNITLLPSPPLRINHHPEKKRTGEKKSKVKGNGKPQVATIISTKMKAPLPFSLSHTHTHTHM